MSYTVEIEGTFHDYPCVVIMTGMGHRCGYVGVPKSHCLYGVGYSDKTDKLTPYVDKNKDMELDKNKTAIIAWFCFTDCLRPGMVFQVHGGLTYSGESATYPVSRKDTWWFGYDCAHAGDGGGMFSTGVVRTAEYCKQECENLAAQLMEVDVAYRERREILQRKYAY